MTKKRHQTISDKTIQNGYPASGLVFNLLNAFYFYSIAPVISKIFLQDIYNDKHKVVWFGVFIFLLMLLETYAFLKKLDTIHSNYGKSDIGAGFIFLWMLHWGIAIFTLFLGLSAMGYNVLQHIDMGNTHWSISLLVFAISIKEIILLLKLMNIDSEDSIPKKHQKSIKQNNWIIDIILIMYSWVAYTITWTAVSKIGDTDMHKENLAMYVGNIIIVSFLFLLFYLPIRIPYLLEENALNNTFKDHLKTAIPILIVMIAAITGL
jgi:uncharacterized membrane protein YidH (DUF202 family)